MDKKLVIFEMANNHMGDVEHGKLIIEEFAKVKISILSLIMQ